MLCFEVTKEEKKLYLLGTAHYVNFSFLPQGLLSLIFSSQIYVTENIDFSKPITREEMARYGFIKEDDNLSIDNLTPEEQAFLRKTITPFLVLRKSEVKIEDLSIKGLFHIFEQAQSMEGIDWGLSKLFQQAEKSIEGLETRAELAPHFEEISFDQLQVQIQHSIECTKGKAFYDQVKALYYLKGLFSTEDLTELYEGRISEELTTRNNAWLPKLLRYLDNSSEAILCGVGVFHLVGENGLVNLLLEKGCTLRFISLDGEFSPFTKENLPTLIKAATETEEINCIIEAVNIIYGADEGERVAKQISEAFAVGKTFMEIKSDIKLPIKDSVGDDHSLSCIASREEDSSKIAYTVPELPSSGSTSEATLTGTVVNPDEDS